MPKKTFMIVGSSMIITILFVLAFITFSVLGITSSNIKKYELTIVTERAEKAYDGLPLSNDSWHIKSGNLDDEHDISVVMPSTITSPGVKENEIGVTIFDENGNVITENYAIDYELGELTVHQRDLVIHTDSSSRYYDGTPLTSEAWYIQRGQIMENHHYEYTMPSKITNPGSIENEIGFTIFDESNADITEYYNITFNLGTLTVKEKKLSVQTETLEKTFDGMPMSSDNWSLKSGSVLDGHTIEYEMDSILTETGSIENDIRIVIRDEDGHDITDHYDIDYDFGTLTVDPIELEISTASDERLYDGTALSLEEWTLENGELLSDHSFDYAMPSSITTPGSIENTINMKIVDEDGQDVTKYYDIHFDLGTLTVYPIELEISTGYAQKSYDGTALSLEEWILEKGELLSGHTFEYSMPSSITNPGNIVNEINLTIVDEDGHDVIEVYDIDYNLGILTVDPIELEISTGSAQKSYDGTALSLEEWILENGELLSGHSFEYSMASTITNPGSVYNTINLTIFDEEERNVTDKYAIHYNLGTLTIKPFELILQSASANKVYDGTPLSNDNWNKVHGTLMDNHQLNVIVDGEITDVGTINNHIFAYITDENDNNVTEFYKIEYFQGTLEVLSSVYSSTNISRESFDIPQQDLFKFHSLQSKPVYFRGHSFGNYNKQGWDGAFNHDLDIDTNPLSFAPKALEAAGNDDYLIQIEYLRDQLSYLVPYFNIDPIDGMNDVFVTGDTSDIISFNFIPGYNGNAQSFSLEGTTYEADELLYRSFVYDHYLHVPESTNAAMLDLAQENGLDASSASIIYDVQQYIQNAATYNLEHAAIPEDVDIAVYFLTVSKEGICQHYATAATLMYRSLGIPARYVTGFLGNGEADEWTTVTQEYGHAWVEVYIDGLGWVPIEVTGSLPLTDIEPGDGAGGGIEPGDGSGDGESENGDGEDGSPGDGSGDGDNGDDEDGSGDSSGDGENGDPNDDDDEEEPGNGEDDEDDEDDLLGMIRVRPVHVREPYQSGLTIQANEVVVFRFGDFLAEGYTYDFEIEGELSTPGATNSIISNFTIYDPNGNDVTNEFDIIIAEGDLQLYKYIIDFHTPSIDSTYDGTPLTGEQWDISDALAEGHYVKEVTFVSSQTDVGSSTNRATITIHNQDGEDVTALYLVNNHFGQLSVTPREITIESASDEKTFDGQALVNETYEIIEGTLAENHMVEIVISGSQTTIGKSVNTIESIKILDSNHQDVTTNYSIIIVEGELIVRPY